MAGIDNNTLLYLRGDNFNDLSLNSKTVTNIGATIVDGGKFGKCMEFNNHTNTKATIPLNYTFNSDFTISAYCSLLKNGTSNCYLIGSESSNNEIHFSVNKDGYLCVAFHNISSQIITSAEKIPLNKIVHIAFVRKSGTLKCYIDGRCVGTVSYSGSPKITTVHLHGGVNTVWQMSSLEVSSVARWEGDFTPPTKPFNSININVTNKDFTKIDFNISKLGQEVINKVEIVQDDSIKETFTDSFDNLTFNHNNKNFKIVVTYDEEYTEELEVHIGNSKAKIYLYKEGNECESLTGGWDEESFGIADSYTRKSVIKNTDNISFDITSLHTMSRIGCNTTIDYSFYDSVHIDVYSYYKNNATLNYSGGEIDADKSFGGRLEKISLENIIDRQIVSKKINTNTPNYFSIYTSIAGGTYDVPNKLNVYNVFLETKENVISINSQNNSTINFSCSNLDDLITITKAEVYVNDKLSKVYTDNFEDITYNIDNSLCGIDNNNITVKVTYTQGDDIFETVEEVLTHTVTVNQLSTTSSLKELIDRQELLTNVIEVQKNNLKSILESKNVEVSEEENKLSILIQKVNNDLTTEKTWIYKDGKEIMPLTRTGNNNNLLTVTKKTDHIEFKKPVNSSISNGMCSTEIIDLTPYKRAYAELDITVNTETENNATFVINDIGDYNAGTDYVIWNNNNNNLKRGIAILDLTNVNRSSRVCFGCWGNSSIAITVRLYRIWLEK